MIFFKKGFYRYKLLPNVSKTSMTVSAVVEQKVIVSDFKEFSIFKFLLLNFYYKLEEETYTEYECLQISGTVQCILYVKLWGIFKASCVLSLLASS